MSGNVDVCEPVKESKRWHTATIITYSTAKASMWNTWKPASDAQSVEGGSQWFTNSYPGPRQGDTQFHTGTEKLKKKTKPKTRTELD